MRRFRGIGGMLFAIFAFAAAMAATASALPVLLNSKGELVAAQKIEGKSVGNVIMAKLNGKKLTCSAATAAKETNELKELEVLPGSFGYLGPSTIKVTGCTAEGGLATCTGEGAAKGEIISKTEVHLVFDSLSPSLGAALLFLIGTNGNPDVKFICEALGMKVPMAMLGSVLCLVKEINVLAKEFKMTCEEANGDPKEKFFWNDEGVLKEAVLLCSENGGTEESCAEETTASVTGTEVKIDA